MAAINVDKLSLKELVEPRSQAAIRHYQSSRPRTLRSEKEDVGDGWNSWLLGT